MRVFLGAIVTAARQQRMIQLIIETRNREQQDLPLTVRGCEHPLPLKKKKKDGQDAFCSQCGRPLQIPNPERKIWDEAAVDSCGFDSFLEDFPFHFGFEGEGLFQASSQWVVGTLASELNQFTTLDNLKKDLAQRLQDYYGQVYTADDIEFYAASDTYNT